METPGHSEMDTLPSELLYSHSKLLKINRELLVAHIRNTQCLLDNLLQNDYFSGEDVEIVGACPTQPDKVPAAGSGRGGTRGLPASGTAPGCPERGALRVQHTGQNSLSRT